MEYFLKTGYIDLESTFNCGQCFRWQNVGENTFAGWSGSRKIIVRQEKEGIILQNVEKSDIPYWSDYFCVDEDYESLKQTFSQDSTLKSACDFAPGIRLLRQDSFETLISFIISQNNNIKRITCIIERLCEQFGENGTFPTPARLSCLEKSDLSPLRAGFRDRYILDAAKKVESGKISLDEIEKMPYNIAKSELMKIVGVGEKVADCVLLFGFHRLEAFPKDVWIKRVLSEFYPNGLPACTAGYEGIAQQFLFHFIRNREE